jgi:cell division protein FtsX
MLITNLLHSRTRALVTISSIALPTAVVSTIVGTCATLGSEYRKGARAIVAVFVIVCCSTIFLIAYSAISPRTRQIAVMRALGGSRSFITRIVLGESSLLIFAGVGLGLALNVEVVHLLRPIYLGADIPPSELLIVSLMAVIAGLGGALCRTLQLLRSFVTFFKSDPR